MKKGLLGLALFALCFILVACGGGADSYSNQDTSSNQDISSGQNTESYEDENDQEESDLSVSSQSGSNQSVSGQSAGSLDISMELDDSITEEIRSFEVNYYLGETLVASRNFTDLQKGQAFDIGVDLDLLEGSNVVTVEYIINQNVATKCIRNYKVSAAAHYTNLMTYDRSTGTYNSVDTGK